MEEFYETVESLRILPRDTTQRLCTVRGVVSRVIPTREREFASGTVMTICVDVPRSPKLPATETSEVRINFYDEWAYNASFVVVGDTVIMTGMRVLDSPVSAAAAKSTKEFYLVPLKEDTTLSVHQRGPLGELMEVRVSADNAETPHVRGVRHT